MDRFHRAARDGYLDALKEGTRRDLNQADEDGMTPTLWAAHEGRLDALRLIASRGGDPDKCDHYGNTALHCAAARGHINCVSYLLNFGVNPWALDNDYHTAKDLAAINNKEDILRYLDIAVTDKENKNKKLAKSLKEKSVKEAEKRVKDFEKIQKKMDKKKEEREKKLERDRAKMISKPEDRKGSIVPILDTRRDSKLLYGQKPVFSELTTDQSTVSGKKGIIGGVNKRILKKKSTGTVNTKQSVASDPGGFKVREKQQDGVMSMRSLQGLQPNSEILYVPKFDSTGVGKRGKLSEVFDTEQGGGRLERAVSEPDFTSTERDDDALMFQRPSIFSRPGFGSIAFRKSMTANLNDLPDGSDEDEKDPRDWESSPWEEQDMPESDSDDDEYNTTPLQLFLAAAGLHDYMRNLTREKIDLDALMMLDESDLAYLGFELGPRKKLLKAIQERRNAIQDPGEMEDTKL